jgi:hypothetical protein
MQLSRFGSEPHSFIDVDADADERGQRGQNAAEQPAEALP